MEYLAAMFPASVLGGVRPGRASRLLRFRLRPGDHDHPRRRTGRRSGIFSFAALLMFVAPATGAGQAREERPQMSERAAVAALMADRDTPEDWRELWRALALAREFGPAASPALRAAVIESAWAEVRTERMRRTGEAAPGGDPDVVLLHFETAESFRDPQAIPLMIEGLKCGGGMNALADLGAAALPAVLAAASDPSGQWTRVGNGLTVLRFMVEDGSLNGRQVEQVREVARERLSGPQGPFIVDDSRQGRPSAPAPQRPSVSRKPQTDTDLRGLQLPIPVGVTIRRLVRCNGHDRRV